MSHSLSTVLLLRLKPRQDSSSTYARLLATFKLDEYTTLKIERADYSHYRLDESDDLAEQNLFGDEGDILFWHSYDDSEVRLHRLAVDGGILDEWAQQVGSQFDCSYEIVVVAQRL